jgi:hypothetical protein
VCGTYVVDVLTHSLEEWPNVLDRARMNKSTIVVPQACPEVVCPSAIISKISKFRPNSHINKGNPIIIAAVPAGPPNSYLSISIILDIKLEYSRLVLIELLVHLLTVLSGPSVNLHHSCRLTICDLFRVEYSLRLSLPQIARRPVRCTHPV